jgi:hypothetical protein
MKANKPHDTNITSPDLELQILYTLSGDKFISHFSHVIFISRQKYYVPQEDVNPRQMFYGYVYSSSCPLGEMSRLFL